MRMLLPNRVLRFAERLSFPRLFALTATLFLITLLVPDPLPFADEILLGLGTLLLGAWRRRRQPEGSSLAAGARANTK